MPAAREGLPRELPANIARAPFILPKFMRRAPCKSAMATLIHFLMKVRTRKRSPMVTCRHPYLRIFRSPRIGVLQMEKEVNFVTIVQ